MTPLSRRRLLWSALVLLNPWCRCCFHPSSTSTNLWAQGLVPTWSIPRSRRKSSLAAASSPNASGGGGGWPKLSFPWSTTPSDNLAATPTTTTSSSGVQTWTTLLDGPCWQSLQRSLLQQQPQAGWSELSSVGQLSLVTGFVADDDNGSGPRVVGIPAPSSLVDSDDESSPSTVLLSDGRTRVYKSTLAEIPSTLNTADALRTYQYAVTHVYALCTQFEEGIGGDTTTPVLVPPSSVVVVGGSNEAAWAVDALLAVGSRKVTWVSTKHKTTTTTQDNLTKTPPGMGDDQRAFSQVVGTFDALLDTLGNEYGRSSGYSGVDDNDDDDDDDDDDIMYPTSGGGVPLVISLLQSRHQCSTYVSVATRAHELMQAEGLLFGPKTVQEFQQSVLQQYGSNNNAGTGAPLWSSSSRQQPLQPPLLGTLVQTLWDAGVVVPLDKNSRTSDTTAVRGWDMNKFWEQATWPTDSSGAANVRFGFPVVEDVQAERDEEELVQWATELTVNPEAALRQRPAATTTTTTTTKGRSRNKAKDDPSSLYIRKVQGVVGLQREIVDAQEDCLLFLSAPFCRTCRKLQQPYQRMARQAFVQQDDDEGATSSKTSNLLFAKADATGLTGKELGRALSVNAVPAFVLFRQGTRYGKPISISKLPSPVLDKALAYLQEGKEWDDSILPRSNDGSADLEQR